MVHIFIINHYAGGKELAKNSKAEFKDICELYLSSSDATTISLGLDMYKNCKFKEVEPKMREIAANKKANNGVKLFENEKASATDSSLTTVTVNYVVNVDEAKVSEVYYTC